MRLAPHLLCCLMLIACGGDEEANFPDSEKESDCDSIAKQIEARAHGDSDLLGLGRQDNPCDEPVAVTKTDYHAACEALRKCREN